MLRKLIESNYYLNDMVRHVGIYGHNKRLEAFTQELCTIDSIGNFDTFRKEVGRYQSLYKGGILSKKTAYSESLLYGQVNALLDYAGLPHKDAFYSPILEHGVDYSQYVLAHGFSRIFQGDYLFARWQQFHPGVPLYAVGPYIYYAQSYYSEETIEKLRHKNGKTLLVFPTHTYELATSHYNAKAFVEHIMQHAAKGFDTVLVSCYWIDAQSEVYKLFEENGATLVSAGFRGDVNFIRRLKTLILLCDGLWGNDMGTFIGYGLYYKKPVFLMDSSIQSQLLDTDGYTEYNNQCMIRAHERFMGVFAEDSEKLGSAQYELCEPYWGFNKIKTPQEIAAIVEINRQILRRAHGNQSSIPKAAQSYLQSKDISDMQYALLEEALILRKEPEL